ncbi:hypothetical protein [Rhodohalobacter sp. 614A]|uniref:hypothetical protein n=1 Tax=Rhodohalobacter sp. 614A TaxID=2908649 RepID=UPI001F408D92|nr:hypothetical protein [Rhodohalobacter sp. 614A]
MATNTKRLSEYSSLLCNCKNFGSLKVEDILSFERLSNYQKSISEKLTELPEIKARRGFDQRMAAAFAMELERETLQRNRSWLEKHPKIKLPEIIADLKKDVL